MDLGLAQAKACVQGGSRGMGRAIAEAFAAEGAQVVVLSRGREDLDETVERLLELGSPEAFGLTVDLHDESTVRDAFAVLGDRWGELNTLVNMAGPVTDFRPFWEVADEKWLEDYSVGALGMVRCVRHALPLLRRAEWARIVNASATSSRGHHAGLASYTAAKSATNSISKNMSIELGPEKILVNTISPGSFATNKRKLARLAAEGIDTSDLVAMKEQLSKRVGLRVDVGRLGMAQELGVVACFVGSKVNSYMTGANINVDGGTAFYA
jgi:3-oxoacyl-[acyl-carrier protein] reductase